MKKLKKVNIREFNRKMYFYLKKLPILVINSKTGESLFKVSKIK